MPSSPINHQSTEETERLRAEARLGMRHAYALEVEASKTKPFSRNGVWYKKANNKFQIFLDKNGWCQLNIDGEGTWIDVSEEDAIGHDLERAWKANQPSASVTWMIDEIEAPS